MNGLWLRSSKRKGRVETRESKRRYATDPQLVAFMQAAGQESLVEDQRIRI